MNVASELVNLFMLSPTFCRWEMSYCGMSWLCFEGKHQLKKRGRAVNIIGQTFETFLKSVIKSI